MNPLGMIGSGDQVKVPSGSVAGVGVVKEQLPSGNHEQLWLVSVTH